ncbi:MAG TPA: hypothetical protein VGO34_07155 [Alphaproteobacteria bacterium]
MTDDHQEDGPSLAAAVHDLNNLFGAILGYAQFIMEDAPAGSPQSGHAEKIHAAAMQGAALAKRLKLGTNR